MITAITTTTHQNEFRKMMKNLDPKPDVWIIFNDVLDSKPRGYVEVFSRIASNYNKLKNLIPDDTEYVVVMEDDVIYQSNIQDIFYNLVKEHDYDILSIPVMHRHVYLPKHTIYPMVWKIQYTGEGKSRYWINGNGVEEIDASSLHYVFMKKDVISKIQFTGVNVTYLLAIDEYFFISAKKLGYKSFCNFDIKTNHRGCEWNGFKQGVVKYWKEPSFLK
jgi:hypothetical protein